MKEMILKTKRLLLRELKQDDFDDICKLLQDPIVMYAYEGAFSKKEVQEWLDKQLRRYQNDGFGLWGLIERQRRAYRSVWSHLSRIQRSTGSGDRLFA